MAAGSVLIALFIWLLGLCVGSFLNVVIYRMPRGLSIARPARSFCPACRAPIAWYDNIPVLSWLLLRARCRRCHAWISIQYPLVEAATGLVFVLIHHLIFLRAARDGLPEAALPRDAPVLLAWLTLAAAFVACSAMDLHWYIIDVRLTYLALVVGLVAYSAWAAPPTPGISPGSIATAASVAIVIVAGLRALRPLWRSRHAMQNDPEPPVVLDEPAPTDHAPSIAPGVAAIAILLTLSAALALAAPTAETGSERGPPSPRRAADTAPMSVITRGLAPTALLALFIATVLAGGQRRQSDQEIAAAIESESPQARREALRELASLTPPVLAGAAVTMLLVMLPAAAHMWQALAAWSPGGGVRPIGGFALAAFGAVCGAALGWLLRIVFTLALGREAFGAGDIHILAAAGAAAGWDIALLAFLLAVGLAIVGWLSSLLLKRSAMIPMGPWLGLGLLAALWLNRPAAAIASEYGKMLATVWHQQPRLILMMAGILLVGFAAALAIARALRRWLEPPAAGPA
jgi:prepilin signal peptidase PulO-like enzyme (type II secretory pathway)